MTTKVEMASVALPTLNEAGKILEAVNTIQNELAYPKEIIVVDGNSTDGTIQIVKKTNFCKLIIEPRRGYGIALRRGMKEAKGDIIIMVDGDGTYEFKHVNRLLEEMIKNDRGSHKPRKPRKSQPERGRHGIRHRNACRIRQKRLQNGRSPLNV